MPEELKGYYTPKQAALLLGIHPKSIFRWLREESKLNTVLVAGQRLIPESEIERLKNCSGQPTAKAEANQ